jgi:hypothetical protein
LVGVVGNGLVKIKNEFSKRLKRLENCTDTPPRKCAEFRCAQQYFTFFLSFL